MDFIKNFTEGESGNRQGQQHNQSEGQGQYQAQSLHNHQGDGSFFGTLTDKMNSAAGGGRESEKDEDMLDKGIDFVQEKFLHQGKQDNESAVEQAKDEQISDFIRKQWKDTTGKEMPVKDKPTRFG